MTKLRRWLGRNWLRCTILLLLFLPFGWWIWLECLLQRSQHELEWYRFDRAKSHLEEYFRFGGWKNAARLEYARTLRRLNELPAAETAYAEYRSRNADPSDEAYDIEQALMRAQLGEPDLVMPYLKSLAEKNHPASTNIFEGMARGYIRLHRYGDALMMIELWLDRKKDDLYALMLRGWIRERIGPAQLSIPDYLKVLELDPHRDEARVRVIGQYIETSRFDEALEYLAPIQDRDDPTIQIYRVRALIGKNRMAEAEPILDEIRQNYPDFSLGWAWFGKIALDRQEYEEAEKWLRKAATDQPSNYIVHYQLYQALQNLGREEEAKQLQPMMDQITRRNSRLHDILTQELAKNPSSAELHAEIGSILLDSNDPTSALHWLGLALRLDSKNELAHRRFAEYHRQRGEMDEVRKHEAYLRDRK